MRKLFLVRHGEPVVTGVLLGQSNPRLSPAGRTAASALKLSVRVVYSSPLRRALETAERMGARIHVLQELSEISYGQWDGKSWEEIEREDPEIARRKELDWIAVTPPGGERWESFSKRVDAALERVRRGPLPAAVVAHAAVNAQIAARLTGADPFSFEQDYCAVLQYDL
jgi:broad specificity phosphatase PhoE